MLKRLLIGTLSFLKKTCAECVTFAKRFASKTLEISRHVVHTVLSWTKSALAMFRKPPEQAGGQSLWKTVKRASITALAERLIFFIGGFICIFLFPDESKGDLTWFETMLKSARDMLKNTGLAMANAATEKIMCLFSKRMVT